MSFLAYFIIYIKHCCREAACACGAGVLSSSGELQYSVHSPKPQRPPLDIARVMRTRYKIDSYQQTYFVINSFQELFDKTAPDFTPIYERLRALPEIAADARAAEEEVIQH